MPSFWQGFKYFLIGCIVFSLLREFWCWFFKINKRLELLESIDKKMDRLLAVMGHSEDSTTEHKTEDGAGSGVE